MMCFSTITEAKVAEADVIKKAAIVITPFDLVALLSPTCNS
jgi:hypothetical protein